MNESFSEEFELVIPTKVPKPYIRHRHGRTVTEQPVEPATSGLHMISWQENLWGSGPITRMTDLEVLRRFCGR